MITKTISIDMDDVLYDFVGRLLEFYNFVYRDELKIEQVTDWDIAQFLKPECKNIFKEFATVDLFNNITLSERNKRALTFLNDKFNLFFVTSGSCQTIEARENLLRRNLPWYKTEQLVRMVDKSKFGSSYHVDDAPHNIDGGIYQGIVFARPWNKTYRQNHSKTPVIHNLDELCSILTRK